MRFCYFIFLILSTLLTVAQPADQTRHAELNSAIEKYTKIGTKDDWAPIILPPGSLLKLDDTSTILPLVKARLKLLGDLRRVKKREVFDRKLDNAVRQFQFRHGLEEDGIIGPGFIKAINTRPEQRIAQMNANLNRVTTTPVIATGKHIVANVPDYKLYVYEDNREVMNMDIVVGKVSNQTVIFSDSLESVVFSPYWYVPESIVRQEILPALRKNSAYLKTNNMEVTGKLNGLPTIRQKPGPRNSLGAVKFLFPNQHNIYFHDTPAKTLFDRQARAFSHGCIRLSDPRALAEYLLKDSLEWSSDRIRQAMSAGSEKTVRLRDKIPVSIIYYTAWVDRSGLINFRDDIYGHDRL